MNIRTEQDWRDQWCAIDLDTYDGADDSRRRHQIGLGATEEAAIADLMEILEYDE
jgi:hypothetical protein